MRPHVRIGLRSYARSGSYARIGPYARVGMRRCLRIVLPAALALLSSACASLAVPRVPPLPEQARSQPSRFIVVTVRNEPHSGIAQAGSTPRGYGAATGYGVTTVASRTVHALERSYALTQVSAWPIATLHVHCIVFRVPPSTETSALIARLARDPRVDSAQPLNQFTTEAAPEQTPRTETRAAGRAESMPYNDPYAPLQRALRDLDVVAAQRRSRGTGVRIAVIDTGVDLRHPDLRGRIIAHRNFVDDDEAQFVRDRHGTEVAGVIAAVANNGIGIVGIAPDSRLLAFKACWQLEGSSGGAVCNSFTLAQGLEAAIVAHADIVNLSLAGPPDSLLARLVSDGSRQGILFVGAVAPPQISTAPSQISTAPSQVSTGFPVDVPGVLPVEAAEAASPSTSAGGSSAGGTSGGDGSIGGASEHLLAPGREVLTLVPDGHYDFASGSSLAAAEVSGVLALMLSVQPHLSGAAAREMLLRSRQPIAEEIAGEIGMPPRVRSSVNACLAVVQALARDARDPPSGSLAQSHRCLCPLHGVHGV